MELFPKHHPKMEPRSPAEAQYRPSITQTHGENYLGPMWVLGAHYMRPASCPYELCHTLSVYRLDDTNQQPAPAKRTSTPPACVDSNGLDQTSQQPMTLRCYYELLVLLYIPIHIHIHIQPPLFSALPHKASTTMKRSLKAEESHQKFPQSGPRRTLMESFRNDVQCWEQIQRDRLLDRGSSKKVSMKKKGKLDGRRGFL